MGKAWRKISDLADNTGHSGECSGSGRQEVTASQAAEISHRAARCQGCQLIEDGFTQTVVVPYGDADDRLAKLRRGMVLAAMPWLQT